MMIWVDMQDIWDRRDIHTNFSRNARKAETTLELRIKRADNIQTNLKGM
jgi:hypothetical protein